MSTTYQTPGVYVKELNAFPNSVVPVATAIPAFVGYTPSASYNGQSYLNKAVRIESFPQFMTYFGKRDATGQLLDEKEQYRPIYYPVPVDPKATPPNPGDVVLNGAAYTIEPDTATIYYLYNSVKLFYANGGGTCYVVSVGLHDVPSGAPKKATDPLVNSKIDVTKLKSGIDLLATEHEPTMIVVPDAMLLPRASLSTVTDAILLQCNTLQSRIGLFDVPGGDAPPAINWQAGLIDDSDTQQGFRTMIGTKYLNYGVAYFPFLKTSVMTDGQIDYQNIGGGTKMLTTALNPLTTDKDPTKPKALSALINATQPAGSGAAAAGGKPAPAPKPGTTPPATLQPIQVENGLRNLSTDYSRLHDAMLQKMNILPPSAAMAGVYTAVDNDEGVWHAPANVTLSSVVDTTVKISDADQARLNVDANAGKSVNAIRLFPGRGITVWGARTLDGNSDDWRYINVRRTLIFIEQSLKAAANAYVFEPNTANTWSLVASMMNNFLTNLWTQGALAGATTAEAFSVLVGLGVTMTAQDILDGVMNISVKVAVSHPAEFIVITIQQQMQTS